MNELSKKFLVKLFKTICDKATFRWTNSKYYYTTKKIQSVKLKNDYSIQFVRLYQHVNEKESILFIKFINGDVKKYRFPNIIGEINNGKKKSRRKNRKRVKRN